MMFALALAGCSRGSPTPDVTPEVSAADTLPWTGPRDVVLRVDNRFGRDILLWVETPDQRLLRLGRSSPGSTTHWSIGRWARLVGGLRFVADPVGVRGGFASRFYSNRVTLAATDTARWTLESDLQRSVLEVRAGVR
ncbi:MAG: hypothetical protein ABIZ91_01805 [Gemmatimonadaceae bacterium]